MPDPTLAEITADVAAALQLAQSETRKWWSEWTVDATGQFYGGQILLADGSDLTKPYWRCACEDWLLARGALNLGNIPKTASEIPQPHGWICIDGGGDDDDVWVHCNHAEAPARLVSAVWRKRA